MGILPEHLLEGEDINTTSFNQNPVGTGRYKFEDWDATGGMITLKRNEDYYGKVPNIETIVYRTVSDETTKATMLQSGEADLAWLNANYASQFKDKDGYNYWEFTTADYRGAAMDMSTDFWKENKDSIGVLNYALDKDSIIAGVLAGQGEPAYSPIQRNRLEATKMQISILMICILLPGRWKSLAGKKVMMESMRETDRNSISPFRSVIMRRSVWTLPMSWLTC